MRRESAHEQSPAAPGIAREPVRPAGFGAMPEHAGVRFRVGAPRTRDVRLHVLTGASAGIYQPDLVDDGIWEFFVRGAGAGDRYSYTLDGSDPRPDPASRFQPEGVHGPSEIIDPHGFRWRQTDWRGISAKELVVYELHVGTFNSLGTFDAARERLAALRDLGVTAVELLPLAEFAGTRNWGYDGVGLYAPSRNYGRPDDLRAFVDAAHALGIGVILDVVYNHLGPEGAYLTQFNPDYITERHPTPWGGAVNLDGPGSAPVRRFILDSAFHWIREYALDGLRLDATHALIDNSPTHIVAELGDVVRAAARWPLVIHAEDSRNLASIVDARERGGWGMDGVWADDFHHVVRRSLAGDTHAYYEDYDGSCEELARTIRQGWLFTGQHSRHTRQSRGTDASRIPMQRFVVCLQNHDQIGNRPHGDRLHGTIDPAAWRAASTVLLTAPMTPLLFMGQEWAASSPFQFFTDLEPDLGRRVTDGRRREFKESREFQEAAARQSIPDPQAQTTFEASKLNWSERDAGIHQASLNLYTALLLLRRAHRALGADDSVEGNAVAVDDGALIVRRQHQDEGFIVITRLAGSGDVTCATGDGVVPHVVLHTEEERFAPDPRPPQIEPQRNAIVVRFQRPGAVIVRAMVRKAE